MNRASATGSGHVTRVAQTGHFRDRPTESGRALSFLRQPGHGKLIFIWASAIGIHAADVRRPAGLSEALTPCCCIAL